MHKRLVGNIVSRVLFVVCLIMMTPLAWAVRDDIYSRETLAFAVTIVCGIIFSYIFRWAFRVEKSEFKKFNAKDGLAIVGLSWLCLSAFGALPFCLSGVTESYTDAFFETVSGFTTTGATIMTDIESLPRGILFWRSLTHWLGGMGIIVLYLALLPALGQGGFQLYKAEAPGPTAERAQPRIKETAKVLWQVYLLFSLIETTLLIVGGMSFFDALCHTFGTMATGGFSTRSASIGAFSPFIQWVIIIFMIIAGANFLLHYQALRGNVRAFIRSEEFKYYIGIIIVLVPIFAFVLKNASAQDASVRAAAFQVTSIMTTTGYVTADFDLWPHALRLILLSLMFIGGCAGSTGGSMKVIRVVLTVKVTLRSILQTIFPNVVMPIKASGAPLPSRVIMGVLAYFAIFVGLFFVGTVFLSATNSCDLATSMSASIASLGNIGPGLGRVGATQNYAWISSHGKWMLAFLMLAGRLELYSILILFVPATWRR